jgi:ribosomal protein L32
MSAATLIIRWNERDRDQALPIRCDDQNPFSRLGVVPDQQHCPSCGSIVYSRRHRLCGACGQVLPADCLLTSTEAGNVELLIMTERQRHKAWLKRRTAT